MRKSGEYGRWPFLSAHLSASHTPQSKGDRSSEMLVLHRDDGKYAIGHSSGQQAILDSIFDLKTILQQLERGGWAVRDLPDLTYIEVDPERLGGIPTIRDRRISAEQIAISFQQGATEDDIQENYEVSPAEVHDAVRWYSTVLTYETAA